jgi:hypothetical protein
VFDTARCGPPLAMLPLRRLLFKLRWFPKGCKAAFVRMQKRRRRRFQRHCGHRHVRRRRHCIRTRRQRAVRCSREATVEKGRGAPPARGLLLWLRVWSAASRFAGASTAHPEAFVARKIRPCHAEISFLEVPPKPLCKFSICTQRLLRARHSVKFRDSYAPLPNCRISEFLAASVARNRPRLFEGSHVWWMHERRAGWGICRVTSEYPCRRSFPKL